MREIAAWGGTDGLQGKGEGAGEGHLTGPALAASVMPTSKERTPRSRHGIADARSVKVLHGMGLAEWLVRRVNSMVPFERKGRSARMASERILLHSLRRCRHATGPGTACSPLPMALVSPWASGDAMHSTPIVLLAATPQRRLAVGALVVAGSRALARRRLSDAERLDMLE
jgi:hypothetical protein